MDHGTGRAIASVIPPSDLLRSKAGTLGMHDLGVWSLALGGPSDGDLSRVGGTDSTRKTCHSAPISISRMFAGADVTASMRRGSGQPPLPACVDRDECDTVGSEILGQSGRRRGEPWAEHAVLPPRPEKRIRLVPEDVDVSAHGVVLEPLED